MDRNITGVNVNNNGLPQLKKSSDLKKHGRTQTGKRSFNCSTCSYVTTNKHHLERHEIIHTGEKLFKCQYCSHRTTQKIHLEAHKRTHTLEMPYKCQHCSYAAKQHSRLITHERIHSGERPFKCGICNYKTAHQSNLKTHERTHTGVKPYKCPQCSYAANQRVQLIRHQRIHSGERPFKCGLCNYAAIQKIHLENHGKTHIQTNLRDLEHHAAPRSTLPIKNLTQSDCKNNPLKCTLPPKAFTKAEVSNRHVKIRNLDSTRKGHKRQSPHLPDLDESKKEVYCHRDLQGSFQDRVRIKPCSQIPFKIFICEECNYALFSKKELRMHYAFCHKQPVARLEDPIGHCNDKNSVELIGAYVLLERIDELF